MHNTSTVVDGAIVSKINKEKPRKNKKVFFINFFASMIIIILLFFIAYLIYHNFNKSRTHSLVYSVCDSSNNSYLLKQANAYLNPLQMSNLRNVVTKIQKLSNYDKDPNCDYVLVSYYSNFDPNQANFYLNKLQQVYNPKVGYSPNIRLNAIGIPLLKQEINISQQNIDGLQKRLTTQPKKP